MKKNKNKLTKLLKIGILFFGISLLLWNCEKEDINLKTENNIKTKIPFRVATFESIVQKKEFKELIEKSKIKSFFDKNSKAKYLGKNNSNEINYTVVKETVKIIEQENYTSYTFLVENNDNTTDNSSFINLVIEKKEENINAFLIKYTPSKEFLLSKNMPFSGELSIKSVDYDKTLLGKQQNPDCGWAENYTLRDCTIHGTNGIYNRDCSNFGKDAYLYSTTFVCGYGGGGSFGEPTYFSNDSYAGGGYQSTNDNSTQTAPVYPCDDPIHGCTRTANKIASALNLTENERLWLNKQGETVIMCFENFLYDNDNSNESKKFAKILIELSILGINNLTNEELENFFNFNKDYKNRMSTSERNIFNSLSMDKQFIYLFHAQKATWRSEDLFPNSIYNGKGDAFRHAYFNAMNANILGVTLAESLSTAHEDKPSLYFYDFKEKEMDLFNNKVGRERKNWFQDGFNSLEDSILEAMESGLLIYLSKLDSTGRATNHSELTLSNN